MADYPVIDADGHVNEPESMWAQYLDPEYHAMAPRAYVDAQGRRQRRLAGKEMPYIPAPPIADADRPKGGADPQARLVDMDSEGMDVAVVYPTAGLSFGGIEDLDTAVALHRGYNDWLRDYCAVAPDRLIGIAAVPQLDVAAAMAETRRAVEKLGFRGIFLRPNPIGGRTLDHPDFDPLWDLLTELDVPATIHEGTTQNVPQAGMERYQNFLFRHVISHPHEQQMAVLSFICGGVLERHPKLNVIFLESGAGWIAHWLERLDHHMEYWGHALDPLPLKPSEYFARQGYISADPDEKVLPGIVQAIGDDNLVFASDYPHPDGIFPGVVAALRDRDDLSESSKAKILGLNAARLYKVPVPVA
jgi:predicted TIM-barrel fold metal-dependent hydrolase